MKSSLSLVFALFFISLLYSQKSTNSTDRELVKSACMDYILGFYEGDTLKITRSVKPTLHKFGFWKNKTTGKYKNEGFMTFEQAKEYALNVLEKKQFPRATAPRKVEIFDISNTIASAKVTVWWGVDYLLLSKNDGIWMIEQVIWEGPPSKKSKN